MRGFSAKPLYQNIQWKLSNLVPLFPPLNQPNVLVSILLLYTLKKTPRLASPLNRPRPVHLAGLEFFYCALEVVTLFLR